MMKWMHKMELIGGGSLKDASSSKGQLQIKRKDLWIKDQVRERKKIRILT